MKKKTTPEVVHPQQDNIDKLVEQVKAAHGKGLDMTKLVEVLAENTTLQGNSIKLLQDAVTSLASKRTVVNIPPAEKEVKPTSWRIEINRDARRDMESLDLKPVYTTETLN